MNTPAREEIYEDLLKQFPDVDADFIAHLVSLQPQLSYLSKDKIIKFLEEAGNKGDLEEIILLYTKLYTDRKPPLPGLDIVLFDLVKGGTGANTYKGSLYQLEWAAAHAGDIEALEVLDKQGRRGIDALLKDGTYVDTKNYSSKPGAQKLKNQILRYVNDFPDIKNHTLVFVYKSGADGVDQAAIDRIKQEVIDYGRSLGVDVKIELWP